MRADALRNRDRLLAAARELFAERGLAVSMDEIARSAGVGVGTAYRRFASRDELIDALFDDRIEHLLAIARDALEDADPWHGLATFLERQIEMQAADRGLKELLFSPARLRQKMARVRSQLLPMVQELIERAQAAGDLRPDVSVTDLAPINVMLGATADLAPELWRRFLPLVLDGLRTRRDAPTDLAHPPLTRAQLDDLHVAPRR
jgi:AcrR family transcriptional regulator